MRVKSRFLLIVLVATIVTVICDPTLRIKNVTAAEIDKNVELIAEDGSTDVWINHTGVSQGFRIDQSNNSPECGAQDLLIDRVTAKVQMEFSTPVPGCDAPVISPNLYAAIIDDEDQAVAVVEVPYEKNETPQTVVANFAQRRITRNRRGGVIIKAGSDYTVKLFTRYGTVSRGVLPNYPDDDGPTATTVPSGTPPPTFTNTPTSNATFPPQATATPTATSGSVGTATPTIFTSTPTPTCASIVPFVVAHKIYLHHDDDVYAKGESSASSGLDAAESIY